MLIHGFMLALTALLLPVDQNPAGNWKMTIKVGHVGEGLRTVILEVTEDSDGNGYQGQLTSMQNRMTHADEVTFEGQTLTVWYDAAGTVTSPSGTQDVTAKRQETQLFAGDAPEPYQKTWRGAIEKDGDAYTIVTRRNTFAFTNPDTFAEELASLAGNDASITGLWRIDKIEILAIAAWERNRR